MVHGWLAAGHFPEIGATIIGQIRTWLRSLPVQKAFKESITPLVVHLSPEALEALDCLADLTHENRSEIINRLILTADEPREH